MIFFSQKPLENEVYTIMSRNVRIFWLIILIHIVLTFTDSVGYEGKNRSINRRVNY